MSGETDLRTLIANLRPSLLPNTYVFCTLTNAVYGDLSHTEPLACFIEEEGLTLVLTKENADREKLTYQNTFRCISLQVHSSLEAVGLTAVVATELAANMISANMIAAYHHDHVLVPSADAERATQLLEQLGRAN
jgi:hypothetical protein